MLANAGVRVFDRGRECRERGEVLVMMLRVLGASARDVVVEGLHLCCEIFDLRVHDTHGFVAHLAGDGFDGGAVFVGSLARMLAMIVRVG